MASFLKQELENNNFIVKNINDDILLIENFLSKEEIDEILKIIYITPEEDWNIEYYSNLKIFCLQKFGRDDIENLVSEGKFEITKNWNDKNLSISNKKIYHSIHYRLGKIVSLAYPDLELSGFATIQRMQEGVELKSHTDQHTDPSIEYAAIIYLNDDYLGGELFFENLQIEMKPDSGSLVLFPGNDEYRHGVRHVVPGPIRYVLVGFIKKVNFYKNNKY
jgi:hypothetical protein